MDDPEFTPDKVGTSGSAACKSLCMWCRAIDLYYRVSRNVAPKRAALESAQEKLDEMNAVLEAAQEKLQEVRRAPRCPCVGFSLPGEGGETRKRGNDTSKSTGRSGRQNAATRRNMRREERVTVQGPVKEQQSDGMSHRGSIEPSKTRGGGGSGKGLN